MTRTSQQMFLHFVAALGNRYDGDPRIGYITAGLYGFWGEEHTYPYNGAVSSQNPTGINWMPSDAFRAQLSKPGTTPSTRPSSRTATPPRPRRPTAWLPR